MTTEAPQAPRWLEYRTVDELPPAVANAKSHDLDALRRSVEAFGFIEPACIDERTGRLLGGHGRADYIRDLEATPEVSAVPEGIVVREDGRWTLPVTRGWSSRDDDHANAAAIALNRVGERGGWDPDVLVAMLDDIIDTPLGDAAGFTADELDEIIAATGMGEPDRQETEPNQAGTRHVEFDAGKANTVTCPKCATEFLVQ